MILPLNKIYFSVEETHEHAWTFYMQLSRSEFSKMFIKITRNYIKLFTSNEENDFHQILKGGSWLFCESVSYDTQLPDAQLANFS